MIDRAMINVQLGEIVRFGDTTEYRIEEFDEPDDITLLPNDHDTFPFVFHMCELHVEEFGAHVAAKPEITLTQLAERVRA